MSRAIEEIATQYALAVKDLALRRRKLSQDKADIRAVEVLVRDLLSELNEATEGALNDAP
jgi:hypothetical protein